MTILEKIEQSREKIERENAHSTVLSAKHAQNERTVQELEQGAKLIDMAI
jgi:hypothetical protein